MGRKSTISLGDIFGKLTVIGILPTVSGKHSKIEVECTCGVTKTVQSHLLKTKIRSCGCSQYTDIKTRKDKGVSKPVIYSGICRECKLPKDTLLVGRKQADMCVDCRTAIKKKKHRLRAKVAYDKIKSEVFDHYGYVCKYCGSNDTLQIDHMNGDGKQHRETFNSNGNMFWYWLRDNNYPDGFQTLCKTCNFMKRSMTHEQFLKHIRSIAENAL